MKKLQNNFTTPEQSKRLLELGVPADSADCYYYKGVSKIRHDGLAIDKRFFELEEYTPCWSVGRLMEVYVAAKELDSMSIKITPKSNIIEEMIFRYKQSVYELDFSKFED